MARFLAVGASFLLLAFAGCDGPPLDPTRATVMPVDLEAAQYLAEQCAREPIAISAAWLPNTDHIKRLEETLADVLRKKLRDAPRMALTVAPEDYYRQYAGVFIEAEPQRRFVYVNGVHEIYLQMAPDKTAWRQRPIVVCGGGSWYFGALYDVDSSEITHFEFNRP